MYGEPIGNAPVDPYVDSYGGHNPNGAPPPGANLPPPPDAAGHPPPPNGPPSGAAAMRPRSRSGSRGRDRSRSRSPRRGGSPGFRRRSPPPKRPNHAPAAPPPSSVLGVFGLSIRTQERDLEDEFSRFGRVEKVTIVYDQRSDRSRGFGFIRMSTVEEAQRCIQELNGVDLNGRRIRVDFSITDRPHAPTPGEYMGHRRRGGGYERGYERGGGGGYERGGYERDRDRYRDRGERDYYGRDNRGGAGGGGGGGAGGGGGGDWRERRSPPPSRARFSQSPPPRRRSFSRSPEPRRDYDGPSGASKPRW